MTIFSISSWLGTVVLFWLPVLGTIHSHGDSIWRYVLAVVAGLLYAAFAGSVADLEFSQLAAAQQNVVRKVQYCFFAFILAASLTGAFGQFV